jgi:hypothetical protein
VGGDTVDYALDRDSLQVSISDAMGHEVSAALLATLLVGSLRNERRRGVDLGQQVHNAGHPFPLRLRDGKVQEVELLIDLPFGVEPAGRSGCRSSRCSPATGSCSSPTACRSATPPNSTSPPRWPTPRGCTRGRSSTLGTAVLHATGGTLRDDATVVCLGLVRRALRPRESDSGTGRGLASS